MSDSVIANVVLPVGSKGRYASGWWGMLALIATEASLFAYLLFSYFYIASHAPPPWPPHGAPSMHLAIPGTLVLIAGSISMWWGERGIERGRRWQLLAGLLLSIALGVVFIALEGVEWAGKPFVLHTSAYSSLYFTITGFHLAHVVVGLLILAVLTLWAAFDYFDAERHSAVSIGVLYWHFVTVVWLAVFFTFYIAPRLG